MVTSLAVITTTPPLPVWPLAATSPETFDDSVPVILMRPPVVPFALTLPDTATLAPETSMDPPRAVLPPLAVTLPEICTLPPAPPPMMILPLRVPTEFARIVPGTLTASRNRPAAVAALRCTVPPSAMILPLFDTSGRPSEPTIPPSELVGTATDRKPSPARSSVINSPLPSPTLPSRAEIRPSLATWPPSSAAKPPSDTLMRPALVTAADAPLPLNV